MISAKVVADSLSPQGHRLTTLEVVMPRYILAEFNTHRVLSKNSASSRAIPFNKMVKEVEENPFIPYAWQKDHKGMQGSEYLTHPLHIKAKIDNWLEARDNAIRFAKNLSDNIEQYVSLNEHSMSEWVHSPDSGITKQLANRLLEPFMWHKVLVSGTEWENFFNLRCPSYEWEYEEGIIKAKSKEEFLNMFLKRYPTNGEEDLIDELELVNEDLQPINIITWLQLNKGQADIHMMFLAEAIYDAMNESTPKQLKEGEWHIPYGDNFDTGLINLACLNKYGISTEHGKELAPDIMKQKINEAKLQISIARCARLSYQTLGDNPVIDYEKDLQLYDVLSKSGHWSPFEHVARVMSDNEYQSWIKGDCPLDESNERAIYDDSVGWCRNFRGFIQQRALID